MSQSRSDRSLQNTHHPQHVTVPVRQKSAKYSSSPACHSPCLTEVCKTPISPFMSQSRSDSSLQNTHHPQHVTVQVRQKSAKHSPSPACHSPRLTEVCKTPISPSKSQSRSDISLQNTHLSQHVTVQVRQKSAKHSPSPACHSTGLTEVCKTLTVPSMSQYRSDRSLQNTQPPQHVTVQVRQKSAKYSPSQACHSPGLTEVCKILQV